MFFFFRSSDFVLIRCFSVAVRSILAVEENENGGCNLKNGGKYEGHAPCDGAWEEYGDGGVDERHKELRDTGADVSPTG